MKTSLSLIFIAILASCSHTESQDHNIDSDSEITIDYAAKWEADEYGMRNYIMALLKEGPNRNQDSTTAAEIQNAHLQNIEKMATEGKLIIAGPFMDDWEVKGIYIFAVETVEEARELTASDPAIKAGRLEMELHPWYGSAALMELNDLYGKLD